MSVKAKFKKEVRGFRGMRVRVKTRAVESIGEQAAYRFDKILKVTCRLRKPQSSKLEEGIELTGWRKRSVGVCPNTRQFCRNDYPTECSRLRNFIRFLGTRFNLVSTLLFDQVSAEHRFALSAVQDCFLNEHPGPPPYSPSSFLLVVPERTRPTK